MKEENKIVISINHVNKICSKLGKNARGCDCATEAYQSALNDVKLEFQRYLIKKRSNNNEQAK